VLGEACEVIFCSYERDRDVKVEEYNAILLKWITA